MPTVDVHPDELRRLTGHDEKDDEELIADLFALGLEYEGDTEDGGFELEFAPDRLDRLSVEGVARSLRYQYGDDRGVHVPATTPAEWTIAVEESVPSSRPYVTGAILRDVTLDEDALESLIQLQEKLHATMGRGRAKGAIGIHDLTMLKGAPATADEDDRRPTIAYRGLEPDGDRFVPLESDAELTPAEVLEEHPTGRTYADLVRGHERYPVFYDDLGLFSFPPVINGRRTEVTTDSRDLFVELTGTDQWTIDKMCTIVCYAMAARGAAIEEVRIEYPEDWPPTDAIEAGNETGNSPAASGTLLRPDLSTKTKTVSHARIESILGIELEPETVFDLGERAGLDVAVANASASGIGEGDSEGDSEGGGEEGGETGDGPGDTGDRAAGHPAGPVPTRAEADTEDLAYVATIPPYRVDVLHPLDVIDDLGRAYGFNDLEPRYPDVGTVGGRHERGRHEGSVRTQLVGLGFEDLLNFNLIGEDELFDRMNLDRTDEAFGAAEPVVIGEPYSEAYETVRTWLLPSLVMVLENNTHRAYPQDLAEIGLVASVDESENTGVDESRHVGAVLARHDAAYEDARARLQSLSARFDVALETPPTAHPSFIDGRVASVVLDGEAVGVIGELHPAVLVEHDLEVPVAAFEFDAAALR